MDATALSSQLLRDRRLAILRMAFPLQTSPRSGMVVFLRGTRFHRQVLLFQTIEIANPGSSLSTHCHSYCNSSAGPEQMA